MNAAQAFIAFLKCEASQAEERAKSLRATAAAIEANAHGGKMNRIACGMIAIVLRTIEFPCSTNAN